ncbi:hypothetical protein ACP275_04G051200 [Erythranthe tilingii]
MESRKVTFLFIGLLSMALLVNSSDIGEEKAQVISLGSCNQHPNCVAGKQEEPPYNYYFGTCESDIDCIRVCCDNGYCNNKGLCVRLVPYLELTCHCIH